MTAIRYSSPKEAKAAVATRYFTGKPCPRGHVGERFASSHGCVICATEKASEWKKDNRDKASAASKRWRHANADHVREIKQAWNAANPEGQKARSARWYRENKDRFDATNRAWRERNHDLILARLSARNKANRGPVNARTAAYQAAKMQRMPKWADAKAIKVVYLDAAEFRQAGIDVHVDHIIPLQGVMVSGLHVANNLRVCLSSVNRSKSNSFQI
jgi:hypothetical protein